MQKRKRHRMMKKTGALQEGLPSKASPPPIAQQSLDSSLASFSSNLNLEPEPSPMQQFQVVQQMWEAPEAAEFGQERLNYVERHSTAVNLPALGAPVLGTQRAMAPMEAQPAPSEMRRRQVAFGGDATPVGGTELQRKNEQLQWRYKESQRMGLFYYTVPEGQRVLVFHPGGQGKVEDGPCRIWRWGKKFLQLSQNIAYPGEFLLIRYQDGLQEHVRGPKKIWFDPRVHSSIEKEEALQLAAKEAVVVYSQESEEPDAEVSRRLVMGPAVFVPEPDEWLHTFCWHGSQGDGYKKIPGAMVFQKLWLMPDQMYHDVEDVRTSDDVVITVKLMVFFELKDVERMLDETHDPIGDFINAASSDVLDLVGRYTFDEFKTRTEQLNNLESYSQLMGRAKQVGYKINKIVYRGYSTTAALQAMHEQAIETRTRLKLQRETETQALELADFKQQREFERTARSREEKKLEQQHALEVKRRQHEQNTQLQREDWEFRREQQRLDAEAKLQEQRSQQERELDFLQKAQEMGVDMTAYLTQGRADQVIEVRGGDGVAPHLHLPNSMGEG